MSIRLGNVVNTVLVAVKEHALEGENDRMYQRTFCVESLLGCSCRTSNCPPKTAYQFKPRSPCRNTASKMDATIDTAYFFYLFFFILCFRAS